MNEATAQREQIIAAALADPLIRRGIDDGSGVDWDRVLEILRGNKVPLLGLADDEALAGCPLLGQARFRQALAEERATYGVLRAEYGLVEAGLARQGIVGILLKSAGLAPSFPYTSDNLDLLVQTEQIKPVRAVLEALGYIELRNVEEPSKFLFRKLVGGQSVAALHLHGLVGWGVPFMDEDALWQRYRPALDDAQVCIPSPHDALLIILAHAFYENKGFKLLDLARMRHCLRQADLDLAEAERVARERSWEDGLAFSLLVCAQLEEWLWGQSLWPQESRSRAQARVAATPGLAARLQATLKRDGIALPLRVSFALSKALHFRKIVRDRQAPARVRLVQIAGTLTAGLKLKLRISGQPGQLVSLSGADGSGKTVHAAALLRGYRACGIHARSYWCRAGSSAWMSRLRRHGPDTANGKPTARQASTLEGRRERLAQPWLRMAWVTLTLLDLVARYNVRVRLPRLFGGVLVCDRYVYDAIVEMRGSLPSGSRLAHWAGRALVALCPRPDVAWLLDYPPQLASQRHQEEPDIGLSPEEGAEIRAAYLELAGPHNLAILDTSDAQDETVGHLVRETLRHYYKDYGTWVNALLLANPSQMNRG